MASNTPSFVQDPTWQDISVQAQDQFGNVAPQTISILPQSQFNQFIRGIQNAVQGVTGAQGNQANIMGPLSLNSNPITDVTNSSPPGPTEALAAGTAAGLYSTFRQAIATKTANYSVTASDGTILVDATSGNIVVTLPDATTVGAYIFPIMKIDSSGHSVTLATVKSQTVAGPATSTTTQWGKLWVQSTGQGWVVVNH